ncbi:MAG TPA: hydroxypyruvate isomerase [Verrucomicrobiae bacterium]|nr:hydroxypyruvate isomerase [Verrucomicrobiae bacterium]
MPKFAANLTMLFTEAPFMERFALARRAGFTYVEYLLPYSYEAKDLKAQLRENGLQQVLFNLPCGDWTAGDRGIAAHPGRKDEFRAGVEKAISYAKALGVARLNCLAGKRTSGFTEEQHWETLASNVQYAAEALRSDGLTLLVEAINHYDIPDFFLHRTEQVLKLIDQVKQPNVLMQYDIYHAQREEGEITATLRRNISRIGHIQVADNPGRNQPGTGEINFPFLFKELETLSYDGYIGLEYVPKGPSGDSFGWMNEAGHKS